MLRRRTCDTAADSSKESGGEAGSKTSPDRETVEDGSTRDFTNKELMDETAKKVDAGLKQMNANAENIGTKIGQIPQTIPAELSLDSKFWIAKVSDNAKLAIIVFVLFFVITAGCFDYATSLAADVKERSEKLTQWYEDNPGAARQEGKSRNQRIAIRQAARCIDGETKAYKGG